MGGIDSLKQLLNVITEIRNKSMDMEFRINEVQEQFRLLLMYKYSVEEELMLQVSSLSENWNNLIEMAERKDFEANALKKSFAIVTKGEVLNFKNELVEEYDKYISAGPGAEQVALDEGMELLNLSKDMNRKYNRKREELVLAEKLFNLPISKFPELIKMEEDNKLYDEIYNIFKEHQQGVKEWSMMPWSKLDVSVLNTGAEKFEKLVRKLQ